MAVSVSTNTNNNLSVSVNGKTSVAMTTQDTVVTVPAAPIYKVEVSSKGPRGDQGPAGDGAGGLLEINDLQDVNINFVNLNEGDILVYDGTEWQSQDLDFLKNVVEDTTPQLGGDIDAQQYKLFTSYYPENDSKLEFTSNDIALTPSSTGFVTLDGRIKLKRFSVVPTPAEGAIYANTSDELFYGVSS